MLTGWYDVWRVAGSADFRNEPMPGLHAYLLFIGAGLLLNITPGADML